VHLGGAVQLELKLTPDCSQVDPAWFQSLKLKYGEALSKFAFNFNLRRYTSDNPLLMDRRVLLATSVLERAAGAYTRSLLSST